MARLLDLLGGWGQLAPEIYSSETHNFTKLRMGVRCDCALQYSYDFVVPTNQTKFLPMLCT